MQTSRDAYGRVAGLVGNCGEPAVAPDHELNRALARIEYDGRPRAIAAYRRAIGASSGFHEAMLRPVRERGDSAA